MPQDKKESNKKNHKDINKLIKACITNADNFMQSAKILHINKKYNVAYHLAVLALEEIGKAELCGMLYSSSKESSPLSFNSVEDHVKKLFWAIWGMQFGKELITEEQIRKYEGLANHIHETRKNAIYVNVLDLESPLPYKVIKRKEIEEVINLVDIRIEYEKHKTFRELSSEDQALMQWFLDATDDFEKRQLIMGRKSLEKLTEFGHSYEWIKWLKEQFDQAEKESKQLYYRELMRTEPFGQEVKKDKWKIRIRYYTNSNLIRPKTFKRWNEDVKWIQLFNVDNRKNEFIAVFILPKKIHMKVLWDASWHIAHNFIIALNLGAMGFYWFYLPKQTATFVEKILDIETNTEVKVALSKSLLINWGNRILDENKLQNTALCFHMLMKDNGLLEAVMKHYNQGLVLLSKIDLHFRIEAHAFDEFYNSLKQGLVFYKIWDQKRSYKTVLFETIHPIFKHEETLNHLYKLGENIDDESIKRTITIEDIGKMKVLCDAFFVSTFQKIVKEEVHTDNNQ